MKKQTIRLKESDLNRIVKDSVNNIIKEAFDPYEDRGAYEDLLDDLDSAYNDYLDAINKFQQFFSNMTILQMTCIIALQENMVRKPKTYLFNHMIE